MFITLSPPFDNDFHKVTIAQTKNWLIWTSMMEFRYKFCGMSESLDRLPCLLQHTKALVTPPFLLKNVVKWCLKNVYLTT